MFTDDSFAPGARVQADMKDAIRLVGIGDRIDPLCWLCYRSYHLLVYYFLECILYLLSVFNGYFMSCTIYRLDTRIYVDDIWTMHVANGIEGGGEVFYEWEDVLSCFCSGWYSIMILGDLIIMAFWRGCSLRLAGVVFAVCCSVWACWQSVMVLYWWVSWRWYAWLFCCVLRV